MNSCWRVKAIDVSGEDHELPDQQRTNITDALTGDGALKELSNKI